MLLRALLIALILTGCAGPRDAPLRDEASSPPVTFRDAGRAFATLERRLLAARSVHMVARIQATGVVSATLSGGLWLETDNRAAMDFAGVFASSPAYLLLTCNGEEMVGGQNGEGFRKEAPAALREGLLLGLTRMGILHNLAVISSDAPPEGTDGRAREWLRVRNLRLGNAAEIDGIRSRALEFDVVVGGTPSATVVLWLSEDSGLPVQRNQRVFFPQGEMTVVEKYDVFELDVPLQSRRFELKDG